MDTAIDIYSKIKQAENDLMRIKGEARLNRLALLGDERCFGRPDFMAGTVTYPVNLSGITYRNQLLPATNRLSAYLLSSLPQLTLIPESNEPEVMLKAKEGDRLLKALHRTLGLREIYTEIVDNIITDGSTFLKVFFMPLPEPGDISVSVQMLQNMIFPLSLQEIDMFPVNGYSCAKFISEKQYLPLGKAEQIYKVSLKKRDKKSLVEVYEYYSPITWEYPEGRYLVFIDTVAVIDTTNPCLYQNPVAWSPYIFIPYGIRRINCMAPQSIMTQCLPLQKEYNDIQHKVKQNIKSFASIKMYMPESGKIALMAIDNSDDEVVIYDDLQGRAPFQATPANLPQHVFVNLEGIKTEIDNLMGIHTIRVQKKVFTATEISLLAEEDSTSLAPKIAAFQSAICRFGSLLLRLAKQGYVSTRLLGRGVEINRNDLASEFDVDIQAISSLPRNWLSRRSAVLEDFQNGIFDDSRPGAGKVRKLLNYNVGEDFEDDNTLDEEFAVYENQHLFAGHGVPRRNGDNDTAHLSVHMPETKRISFVSLSQEIQQVFFNHIEEHNTAMQQLQMQAMQMQQAQQSVTNNDSASPDFAQQQLGNTAAGGTPVASSSIPLP